MSQTCAIIAGSGTFPLHVAREAKRDGWRVAILGIEGWADQALAQHADVYEEIVIGQLGRLIERLRFHQITKAIFAGKVTKRVLFDSGAKFDLETIKILSHAKGFTVDAILGAVAKRLAQDGIELLDSSTFLKSNLCPEGVLTQRKPTPVESEDIRTGVDVLRQLAPLDIGQTVVIKHRVIVAVEALEGTDAAITRAGQLAGSELVVVKMASPKQDMRFDIPIIGPQTLATIRTSGVSCLAVEAGKTLLLDKDELIRQADAANVAILGITSSKEPA